jgi:branched-chain amino acid transport system ATP-binding protein
MLLEFENVVAGYGPIRVLHGVTLSVNAGEIVALLGRNGAGKSTTLKAAAGMARVFTGQVRFKLADIARRAVHQRARLGLGYVPEERRIFPELTVRENLEVARKRGAGGQAPWTLERIFELMPLLAEIQKRRGGHLSGGEQQMLTIARTMMGNPELLLLDEPTEGLAPHFVRLIGDLVLELKRNGMAVLVAEQNLQLIKRLVDRAYVLESGEIRLSGGIAELAEKPELKALLAV